MAGNTETIFGFELLQKLTDNDICKKEDVLILFVHWYIIKRGFKCIGLGDSKTFDLSERGSELLPENWNKRPNYALRYLKDGKLFILHGVKSDEDLLLNLLRVEDDNVANIQFPVTQTINELHGPLEALIPSYQTVLYIIRKDLVEPVHSSGSVHTCVQTSASSEDEDEREHDCSRIVLHQLRVNPSRRPSSASRPWNPESDPTRVGSADLDPFARGRGGGMIYDPFTRSMDQRGLGGLGVPGRLPPGAVPPGARFDPFGPPDVPVPRRPQNPDDDYLPPPGCDDMFM